jgi:hypothetical protein
VTCHFLLMAAWWHQEQQMLMCGYGACRWVTLSVSAVVTLVTVALQYGSNRGNR